MLSGCFSIHTLCVSVCLRPRCVCHAHPDVPVSLMKNRFRPHSFQSAKPPKKRCLQQAEHGVIPLWTRRLPPVHNPTLLYRRWFTERERAVCFSFCFSSHSFSSDWPHSSLRNRWHLLNLSNLINRHPVCGCKDLDVTLLIAECLNSAQDLL